MSGRLIVVKGGKPYDMSELVESVRWNGRKGAAARSLSVTLLDDDGYGHERSGIDVEQGHSCIYSWKGEELFRGMFMRQEQSRRKVMPLVAYDNGIRLANNTDTFNYSKKTASYIFRDCCDRFKIPYGVVAETGYRIPELPKPKTTAFDVVCDALSQTYKATGIRYYPACLGEQMQLLRRRDNVLQWVIETGINLEDYRLTKSIENVKTRIKLLSKEGKVIAQDSNSALESKIGIFQDVVQVKDSLNSAQLHDLVTTTLAESSVPERALTITATQGITDVRTGVGVFIIIKELGISKTYYVDEDDHVFKGNHHQMKLKLVAANDIVKAGTGGDIKIGDVVQFLGGNHYYTSMDNTPVGGNRTPGLAKVTNIAKGAAHEYHLIGGAYSSVGGSSNVYGWVNASQIAKKGG